VLHAAEVYQCGAFDAYGRLYPNGWLEGVRLRHVAEQMWDRWKTYARRKAGGA
jgi:hypothetical protein